MPEWQKIYSISPSLDSTLALEVFKTGLQRGKKHIFFFENFRGELAYVNERPESSRLDLTVDAGSVVCRDPWLRTKQQKTMTCFARGEALDAARFPEIRFSSSRISAKPLRGFVVEGVLALRGTTRNIRVNMVLASKSRGWFQIDGDATLRLTDFGIRPPSSMWGLAGAQDEALLRVLLWAAEPVAAPTATAP